jgi:hypothetical protein
MKVLLYDLKLSRRLTLIKSSQAISLVDWLKIANISGAETILEMPVIFKQLT